MKPVSTPLRSRTALVTTVVAPSTWRFARLITLAKRSSSSVAPCTTASAGFFGVLKTLCRCNSPSSSSKAKSVKVPPVSNASLAIISSAQQFCEQRGNSPDRPDKSSSPDNRNPVMVEATGCSRSQPTQVRSAAIDFAYGAVRIPCGCLRMSFSTTSSSTDRTATAGSDSGR